MARGREGGWQFRQVVALRAVDGEIERRVLLRHQRVQQLDPDERSEVGTPRRGGSDRGPDGELSSMLSHRSVRTRWFVRLVGEDRCAGTRGRSSAGVRFLRGLRWCSSTALSSVSNSRARQ
jgi:hypothetical protein